MSSLELATAWVKLVPSVDGISDQLTNAFMPGVGAAEKEGEKAGKGWSAKVKGALGAAAIVGGVVATFKGLYSVGEIFDDVTDTIRVGTGAQGDALDDLVQSAKNVGLKVPAEFEKIGPTIADLNTRFGMTGKTVETVASQYLEAGRILGEEVDINATSAAFSAFKIEGDAVADAMDSLFRVSQATGVGMNELASGVKTFAPALQSLGFTFEDSISLLGQFDKLGMNSTQVLASMSKGLITLAKDGEQPQDAFARVSSEIQNFIDVGDEAGAKDLASTVFGTRGADQMIEALKSGVFGMEDLMAATGATGDTILGVGEETMDFAETWQMTMNTAMVAIEPLATAVFAAIGDGLAAAMPFLQELGAWVGENVGVIAAFAAVIGGTLVVAMIAWTASVWASTFALLANPITWIILAIVALIAAVVLLVMNWDTVVAWITDIWSGFITWITGVIDGFASWWSGIWGGISQFFSDLWNGIVSFVQDAINNVATVITAVTMIIRATWMNIWTGISSFFTGIWNGIIAAVNAFGGFFRNAFNGIAGFVQNAFAGVLGAVKGPINGIISIVNSAIRALNGLSVSIPDWVPVVGGQTFGLSLPTIPQLALGATILPRPGGTLAVLAEAGRPESVVDTGLMNRALEEGLDGGSSGSFDGQRIRLVVRDREFDAFLEEVADGRVGAALAPTSAGRMMDRFGVRA